MVHLQLLMLLVYFSNVFGYIEYVEVSNCESCTLMLTCRHLNSVIAVFSATFEPFDANSSYVDDFLDVLPPIYPRLAVNRRCSGVNHCSFILNQDCPGADRWGAGNFTVKYACVSDRRMMRYCNENITLPAPEVIGVSEGFIKNPGYPKFYLGHGDCTWRIQAPSMQKIKLTVLDLSLIGSSKVDNCHDIFEIKETGNTVFASCLEQEPATEILSVGDVLDITLSASASLTARRGVLFHYTALGCPTPSSPKDGYLVYRNDTVVIFNCCVGYVFPDSNESKIKELKCFGHTWNHLLPLPNCIKLTKAEESDLSIREIKRFNNNKGIIMTETESLTDIVLPSILILALFVVNSIVLFVIYKYKKRKSSMSYTEEAELGTMNTQRNGN